MELIRTKKLEKFFPTPGGILHAVDGVDISIEKGHTLGVVGESGCGKSTLGHTVLRLSEPTGGEIWFDGENISSITKRQFKELRPKMQMIFQDPFSSLNPRMTISQNIAEPLLIYRREKGKEALRKRIASLMDTAGISQRYANSYPHELDGGRRQRVVIARALALEPRFIVCDEPVSALDVSIQAQVINLLRALQREKELTYMFITHDLSVVKHMSDEICVMYLGRIVERCSSSALFKKPLHPYTQALLSSIPVPSLHNRKSRIILRGEVSSPIDPPNECRFCGRCSYAEELCFREEPALCEKEEGHFAACHLLKDVTKPI